MAVIGMLVVAGYLACIDRKTQVSEEGQECLIKKVLNGSRPMDRIVSSTVI